MYYEFLVIPFNLTNAFATFMDFINRVFKDYLDNFEVIFIDEILIYSQSYKEHENLLRIFLTTLREKKLYEKFKKYDF